MLDVLKGLAEESERICRMGTRDTDRVTVVLSVGSKHDLSFVHHAGDCVPIPCSALGKALLAYPHASLSAETVIRLGPACRDALLMDKPERLIAELEQIRKQGYAIGDEEHHIGVRSVALVVRRGNQHSAGGSAFRGRSDS